MAIVLRWMRALAVNLYQAATAAMLCQLSIWWIVVHGTTPMAAALLMFSAACGIQVSGAAAARMHPQRGPVRGGELLTWLSMSAVVVLLCWLAPELLSTSSEMGASLTGPGGSFLLACLPSAAVMTTCIATVLIWQQMFRASTPTDFQSRFGLAAVGVCGLLTHGVIAFPPAITCTILIVAASASWFMLNESSPTAGTADGRSKSAAAGVPAEVQPGHGRWQWLATSCACGLMVIGISEVAVRLFPGTITVFLIAAALSLTGCGVVLRMHRRVPFPAVVTRIICLMIVAALPWCFSFLAERNLAWNSTIGTPWLLMLTRALQIAVLIVPTVIPLLMLMEKSAPLARVRMCSVTAASAGLACCLLSLSLGPVPLLATGIAVGVAGACLTAVESFRALSPDSSPRRRVLVPFAAGACALVLCLSGSLDSSRTAQLLFSERAVAAVQLGLDREMIPQSDATRLVDRIITSQGDITVWRRNGYLFEFRRNGLLLGKVSSDTRVCPQPPEDMLLAVIPMVLHPSPGEVLLLGDDTGTCLRSCASFPLQHITAVRTDAALTQLARRFTWSRLQVPPDEDDRVTLLSGSAPLAVRQRWDRPFDVIIADSGSSATAAATPEFTREFYQAARRQLAAGGVFCQRFRQSRFGPDPLTHALATLSGTFAHAVAIQTVPGEVVLLATDAQDGLLDDKVLSRLQRTHVRREIATSGWDWCQVAALPMLDASDPIGLFSEGRPPQAISVSNSWFACAYPLESARWGNKSAELAAAFGPHQSVLAENVAASDDHVEANRRISALQQEVEILCGIPDQPFVYRKSLRTELQRNPRPPVEVIRNGNVTRTAHPLDVLRREYFEALGAAVQATYSGQEAETELRRLAGFTAACEPLLSRFAHHELLRLYEVAGHPDAAAEFQHRMHVVYYAQQADASVRPVIAALRQLSEDPTLIDGEAERFDHFNSMLQKLIERWESRTAWEPDSARRVQDDVEQSIHVANQAMDRMQDIASSAGVSEEEFRSRRRFINAALIRPLRDYHRQVLAHRLKTESADESVVDDGSDLPLLLPSESLNTN